MLTFIKQIFTWWNHQTLGTRLHTILFGKLKVSTISVPSWIHRSSMVLLKNTYIAILCLAFGYSILKSYQNILKEPTAFQESVLTNVTFAPRKVYLKNIIKYF